MAPGAINVQGTVLYQASCEEKSCCGPVCLSFVPCCMEGNMQLAGKYKKCWRFIISLTKVLDEPKLNQYNLFLLFLGEYLVNTGFHNTMPNIFYFYKQ